MTTLQVNVNEKHDKDFRIPPNVVLPSAVGKFNVIFLSQSTNNELDWRTKGLVTPVKNQGQCGSCYVFSVTGTLEGQLAKQSGKLVSLSEQQIVDCSGPYGNAGCNGGYMDNCFEYLKNNSGLDTEQSYPYTAQDGNCRFKPKDAVVNVTVGTCGEKVDYRFFRRKTFHIVGVEISLRPVLF